MSEDTKPRVILVDDDQGFRSWLKNMMIGLGCEVIGEGSDGREAIDLYKAEQPDLTILDIHMPEVDGRLALSLIRANDENAYIVMLTSIEDTGEMLDRLESGADCYVLKHSPPEEIENALREQIAQAMARKRS
jgi:DNA-binding NarL/FixJ family response regulator